MDSALQRTTGARRLAGCRLERYNVLALDGWLVLRVDRGHVVDRPEHVRDLLVRGVARGG